MKKAVTTVSLSKFGMVYYNNLLSVPLLLVVAGVNGEVIRAIEFPAWDSLGFLATLVISGIVGFALNGAALWCVQATSPSTYSMVGALNKIPLAVRWTEYNGSGWCGYFWCWFTAESAPGG